MSVWAHLVLGVMLLQQSLVLDGIQPLTEHSFEAARQVDKVDPLPYLPVYLRLSNLTKEQSLMEYVAVNQYPWTVHLQTPYLRVALPVAESKRKYLPVPPMQLSEIDNTHVTVSVQAVDDWRLATDVENAVLIRGVGTNPIQATSKRLQAHEYRNAMGAVRTIMDGEFDFSIEAFAPTSAVTIVIVGGAHRIAITLTPDMLRKIQ